MGSTTPEPQDSHQHVANFSFFVAVCFTINYIVGCGFLGVPYAFVKSGMVVGPILVIFFAYMCNVSKDYILETLGRLEALEKVDESAGKGGRRFVSSDFVITTRKYELADAAERLVGRHFKTVYMLLLCLFLYGVLWAYSSVFGTSFAGQIPSPFHGGHICNGTESCEGPIRFWVLIFGLIAVPLSCMDLQEQVAVQVFMSAARVVVMLMMVATVFAALSCDGYAFEFDKFEHKGMHNTGVFFASGLHLLIPTTVYASIFHHSIPVLSQPVKDKTTLRGVFGVGFAFTTLVYVILGLILGLYFGSQGNVTQVNLYWHAYVGCKPSINSPASGWAQFARFIILIFPALDVMSAYPLNAVTLGNNLMTALLGANCPPTAKHESVFNFLCPRRIRNTYFPDPDHEVNAVETIALLSEDADEKFTQHDGVQQRISHEEKRRLFRWKIFFRLLASVPSLIGSVFKNDLGQILDYTGTVAILIAFVIPCILRYQSIRVCVQSAKAASGSIQERSVSNDVSLDSVDKSRPSWAKWIFPSQGLNDLDSEQRKAIQTPYWSIWSSDVAQHAMTIIGFGVFFYVLISLIQG